MNKIISITLLLSLWQGAHSQTWEHVGPKSDNQTGGNGFETSQLNNITIDPLNPSHLFASGACAGLWESTTRGEYVSPAARAWYPVDNSPTGENGVSAVAFLNANEIMVGNMHSFGKIPDDNFAAHHTFSTGRVHQSHIINITHIRQYDKGENACFIMSDKTHVPVAQRKRNIASQIISKMKS